VAPFFVCRRMLDSLFSERLCLLHSASE
jgi:hypothetical protein